MSGEAECFIVLGLVLWALILLLVVATAAVHYAQLGAGLKWRRRGTAAMEGDLPPEDALTQGGAPALAGAPEPGVGEAGGRGPVEAEDEAHWRGEDGGDPSALRER